MSPSWLDELERSLEERLSAFLEANPYQEMLLHQQDQQDRARNLEQQRQLLQQQAKDHRQQLLKLASSVREWKSRVTKARTAGAIELADRADQHISQLMLQGRELWSEFRALGQRFDAVEEQLASLHRASTQQPTSLEDDWAQFEADHELERLKRQAGE